MNRNKHVTCPENRNFREVPMMPLDQPKVLNTITRSVLGNTINVPCTMSMERILDTESLKKLAKNVWDSMWKKLSSFGTYTAGFM